MSRGGAASHLSRVHMTSGPCLIDRNVALSAQASRNQIGLALAVTLVR